MGTRPRDCGRSTTTNSAAREEKCHSSAKFRVVLAAAATGVFKKWGDKQKPNPYQKLVSSFFFFCSTLLSTFCNIISVSCGLNMSLFIFFLCNRWDKYRMCKHHWLTCFFACMHNITCTQILLFVALKSHLIDKSFTQNIYISQ